MQIYFCGAWRSLVARPAGGREVVGSNPAAPTIIFFYREEKLKKIFIIVFILAFVFACSSDEKVLYEIEISKDKIEFPFKDIENGKFISIYKNYSNETIPISTVLISNGSVMENSQDLDLCEGVNALRNGKSVQEWIIINHNLPVVPEFEVINSNDHPNLVSYSFPLGTYLIMLMDPINCNKDNYVIFDVTTNDGLQIAGDL